MKGLKSPQAAEPASFYNARTSKSPAGTKNHHYEENDNSFTEGYVSKWKGIFRGTGLNHHKS